MPDIIPDNFALYTPLKYHSYEFADASEIHKLEGAIEWLTENNQIDSVVSIFMIPYTFANLNQTVWTESFIVEHFTSGGAKCLVGGYVPRNKKLLCYPYNYFVIDVGNDSHMYKYEDFDLEYTEGGKTGAKFNVKSVLTPNPEIIVYPVAYRGSGGGADNACESVTMNGFPQIPFIIDSYRGWLAQKSVEYGLTQGDAIMQTGLGFATGALGALSENPLLAISGAQQVWSGMSNMTHSNNQAIVEQTKGSKVRGTIGSSVDVGTRNKQIYIRHISIKEELAESLDSYFDIYGYNISAKKYPGKKYRTHWTYCKTANCQGHGNIPSEDIAKIKNIYNKGVTWWRSLNNVGNYNLTNSTI